MVSYTKINYRLQFRRNSTILNSFQFKSLLLLLLPLITIIQVAQSQGPCNAHRWEAGDGWRKVDGVWTPQVFNGKEQPRGIVRCASSAETESGLQAFAKTYNSASFPIDPSLTNCFNQQTEVRGVGVSGPISGQTDIVWFNFDIRPLAGTYQFQIITNQTVGWALYYSEDAQPITAGGTVYPATPGGLSGSCGQLAYADCGISGNGWSTITVPSFKEPTNYYLAMWPLDGGKFANSTNLIYKSRYGCGGATCFLEKDGADRITCNATGFTVCTDYVGSAGKWRITDNATTQATSYTVTTYRADGTQVASTTSNDLTANPLYYTLGTIGDNGAIKATICATYASGTGYDIILTPDATFTTGSNYVTCTSGGRFSGTFANKPTVDATATPATLDLSEGNSVTLGSTVTGGTAPFTYVWTQLNTGGNTTLTNANSATATFTVNSAAGLDPFYDFQVEVTDALGCVTTDVVRVVVTASAPPCNIQGPTIVCEADAGSITYSYDGTLNPNFDYTWTVTGDATPASATGGSITVAATGNFTVTLNIVSKNSLVQTSCQKEVTLSIISANAVPTPAACNGAASGSVDLTVSGGTAPYTYLWSNGATTQDLTNVAAGTYTVTITDDEGCTQTASATVGEASAIVANAVPTPAACNGAASGSVDLTVSGGTAPYTYLWSNGATTQDLTNVAAGTYTVTITDDEGCTQTASATVGEASAIVANAVPTPAACNGAASGSVDLTVSGGTAPYTYLWSNGATTQDLTNVAAGTYTVTITDDEGCTQTASATVGEASAIVANAVPTPAACNGAASGSVDLTVSGGTAPYTYLWSNGATTQDLTNVAAGTYTVTITDDEGCTQTASATVGEASAIVANAVPTPAACNGAASGSVDLTVSGGTAPYTYLWSNGATTQDLTNVAAGTYTVTITDDEGCTQTASATVGEPLVITLGLTSTEDKCTSNADGTVTATFSGGTAPYSLTIDGGTPISATSPYTFMGLGSGSHTIVVTDANGCIMTGSVNVGLEVCEVFEGCTPGYWKNHPKAWGCGYTPSTSFLGTFTVIENRRGLKAGLNLMDALNLTSGGYSALARHAVSALLNACHNVVDYPYTEAEIKAAVVSMFNTGTAVLGGVTYTSVESLKNEFDRANNLGCPLNNGNMIPTTTTIKVPTMAKVQEFTVPVELSVSAAPNPYTDKVRFTLKSPVSGQGSLEVYNMLGQKLRIVYQGYIQAGEVKTIDYQVPNSIRSNLIYMFQVGQHRATGKLIHPH